MHKQRAARLVEADGDIGPQALAQHQQRLEVLEIKGDICSLAGAVPVVQEHLSGVHC